MEIERKYLIKSFPGKPGDYRKREIEQGYLCRKPVVRIRKNNDEYILTYKRKLSPEESGTSAIVNEEIEMMLTPDGYEHLLAKIDGSAVTKTRYLVPLGTLKYQDEEGEAECTLTGELDVFHGSYEGLRFIEVEFPSIAAADTFTPPEWFGEDVSREKRYSNGWLSAHNGMEDFINAGLQQEL